MLRWPPIEGMTGGVQGLYVDLPEASAATGLSADRWIFLLSLGLLALGALVATNLATSRSGRALKAARDHDLAASVQGIDVAHVRAVASGWPAGISPSRDAWRRCRSVSSDQPATALRSRCRCCSVW